MSSPELIAEARGGDFEDRGDYQTAVDNGFIWRNVERALDAILPATTPAANKGESE